MAQSDFSISITKNAIDVRHTPSESEPRGKIFGFHFSLGLIILMNCALLFLPGKRGRSMWHDMTAASFASSDFFFPLTLLLFMTTLMTWLGFRYARAAWPSDETLHCDRSQLTISRVPWLDFHNRTWRTHTYPLSDVSRIRFAVIASAKERSFWGIRFNAAGRQWALPGLEAPEAKNILVALKGLGADVPRDPKLEKRIKQTLEMRGDTSWMDRSWMDHDSTSSGS